MDMSLITAEVLLVRCGERLPFQAEQLGIDGTIRQTLDEQRDERVFIHRTLYDITWLVSYMLSVSVYITLTLFDI